MKPSIETELRARHKAVYSLIELIERRETVATEADFLELTAQIGAALWLVRCPSEEVLQVRRENMRAPWIRIIELLLADMAVGAYPFAYKFDQEDGQDVLLLRTSEVMYHFANNGKLAAQQPPITAMSDRMLKKAMKAADVLLLDSVANVWPFERTLNQRRFSYMAALRLSALHLHGLQTFAATQGVFSPSKP